MGGSLAEGAGEEGTSAVGVGTGALATEAGVAATGVEAASTAGAVAGTLATEAGAAATGAVARPPVGNLQDGSSVLCWGGTSR